MINIVYTILPIITLIVGFYFGFRIGKDKEIPEIKTPVQIVEEHKEKKEEKKKRKQQEVQNAEMEEYLANIDRYPNNQVKIDKE